MQRELVSSLTVERAAELVNEMTPAQAADILAALPDSDSDAILEKVRRGRSGQDSLTDREAR